MRVSPGIRSHCIVCILILVRSWVRMFVPLPYMFSVSEALSHETRGVMTCKVVGEFYISRQIVVVILSEPLISFFFLFFFFVFEYL